MLPGKKKSESMVLSPKCCILRIGASSKTETLEIIVVQVTMRYLFRVFWFFKREVASQSTTPKSTRFFFSCALKTHEGILYSRNSQALSEWMKRLICMPVANNIDQH